MNVSIIAVPWDSGHRAIRMGGGPVHLLESGIEDAIRQDGHTTRVSTLESTLELSTEVAGAFDLARSIADAVRTALAGNAFPLVLAGNCFSALGTVTGLGARRTGILWLDAHGDLNTPETTTSGFLDGMAAATITGRCWTELTATLPGFGPVPDRHLLLVGARDLDAAEVRLIGDDRIRCITTADLRRDGPACAGPPIARIADNVDGFYLHVDLDVLDPDIARANGFAAPGGLAVRDIAALTDVTAGSAPITGAAITAYDPAYDRDGEAARAAVAIARAIVRSAVGAGEA